MATQYCNYQPGAILTLQSAASANGNGNVAVLDGADGVQQLFIHNGAGTCTLTINGSLDPTFATAQDTVVLGLVKLWDSGGGVNTSRSTVVSGALSIAANTSYLYSIQDIMPYVQAVISSASGLASLTAQIYALAW